MESIPTMNSSAFLQLLKNGDAAAYRTVYKNVFPSCSHFIINNNGTMNDARDVFQESLMVLIKNLRKDNFELTAALKTYLYSIMRNLWLKRLNKQNRGGLSLTIDDPSDMEFILIAEDGLEEKKEKEKQLDLIAKILENFKEDCKKILTAFYFEGKSMKEIATLMDYTNQFIRVKKARCMTKFKQEIRKRLGL